MRFAAAGAVTAAVDMALLYLLVERAGLNYLIAVAVAFLAAATISYVFSIAWIFTRGRHAPDVEVLAFLVTSAGGLLLNELIVFTLVHFLSVWYLVAKAAAIGAAATWNFWCRRRVVFAG